MSDLWLLNQESPPNFGCSAVPVFTLFIGTYGALRISDSVLHVLRFVQPPSIASASLALTFSFPRYIQLGTFYKDFIHMISLNF